MCDCLLEFLKAYIVIQIKEKDNDSSATFQKWFKNKAKKIAKNQPSRKQTYLIDYFSKIDKQEREKVKYVVTDLCPVYIRVIKTMLPNAKHIADRFHWIRIIINAIQTIRIISMKFHYKVAEKMVGKCTT